MPKKRLGFVSNSSSSSFVCDVCRKKESGYDARLKDFDMSCCENGHEFCNGHMVREMSDLSRDELLKYAKDGFEYMNEDSKSGFIADLEDAETPDDFMEIFEEMQDEYGESDVPAFICPICGFTHVNDSDLRRYLEKLHGVPSSSALGEIKKTAPGRNYMTDAEYNHFVLKLRERTREDINEEIVKKFNHDYSAFVKFLD